MNKPMPEMLTQTSVAKKLQRPSVRASCEGQLKHNRGIFFFLVDFVFLVLVSIAATLVMHMIHMFEWSFVPTSLIGMIAAMLVQTVMAFAAAPLLGSIETMVPSMIVAMLSPMSICLLHLFGCESTWMMAVVAGSGFAIATFAVIQLYARSYARTLMSPAQRPQG